MAVSALTKIIASSVEITEAKYDALLRDREQLRILKNFIKRPGPLMKTDLLNLIAAMEVSDAQKENTTP